MPFLSLFLHVQFSLNTITGLFLANASSTTCGWALQEGKINILLSS